MRGLNAVHGRQIVAARSARAFESLQDFRFRTGLGAEELRALAKIGALNGLSEHRRAALWQVEENVDPGDLFSWTKSHAAEPVLAETQPLSPMTPGERTTTAPD